MLREYSIIKNLILNITINFHLLISNLILWDYLGVHNSVVIIHLYEKDFT